MVQSNHKVPAFPYFPRTKVNRLVTAMCFKPANSAVRRLSPNEIWIYINTHYGSLSQFGCQVPTEMRACRVYTIFRGTDIQFVLPQWLKLSMRKFPCTYTATSLHVNSLLPVPKCSYSSLSMQCILANNIPVEEAACKDFGARRDLTGISQFCKGNGSGRLKLEEFNEFRCKDQGIESQVVDSCPLLERLRRRSMCQQEDRAKLRNNLELRKANDFSNQLDLCEADPLHHTNRDVQPGQSPFTGVCPGDRAKMMRCGRYDELGCLGSIKPVQRSHSTPSRSKETPGSSQLSTPSTPRHCISPRACVPRSPYQKSQIPGRMAR